MQVDPIVRFCTPCGDKISPHIVAEVSGLVQPWLLIKASLSGSTHKDTRSWHSNAYQTHNRISPRVLIEMGSQADHPHHPGILTYDIFIGMLLPMNMGSYYSKRV